MYTALTIAGSDSSGGAGIQADIKTMTAHNVYAMSVITALTAQNTTGLAGILSCPPDFLGNQLDAVFTDIFPDAVKIGMLSGREIMEVVAFKLIQYKAKHVVLDPVMVSTSGSKLIVDDSIDYLKDELFPLAEIITPNITETECLTGIQIKTLEDMKNAAMVFYESIKRRRMVLANMSQAFENLYLTDTAVLVKGGHSINDANDILVANDKLMLIAGNRVENSNTHGTGCTLSSAIASNLAIGFDIEASVRNAKAYISGALEDGLNLGKGSGPLNHMWNITDKNKVS